MSQSNQNTPYSKPSNGDDFVLKEDNLGVDTTSPDTNDSSPSQHGIRGSEGHISGNLNKAIEGRQRAIAAGNQLKQDWLDAEHWRALANARDYRLPHWYLPLTAAGMEEVLHDLNLDRDCFRECFGSELKSYQSFVDMNPKAPLWAFAGWILEQLD